MAAYWRITEVRVLDDHAILVRFTDGLEGVVRFSPDFFQGMFSHLCDPVKFREVAVVDGAVTWPGGLNLAPDAMYQEIKHHGERHGTNGVSITIVFDPGNYEVNGTEAELLLSVSP